jgi:hypothetical protein
MALKELTKKRRSKMAVMALSRMEVIYKEEPKDNSAKKDTCCFRF